MEQIILEAIKNFDDIALGCVMIIAMLCLLALSIGRRR